MSAFAALSLQNNAAATVTFNPLTIDSSGVASWATSDAIYDAKSIVTVSTKVPNSKSTKARLKAKVVVPLMDSVNTTLKVDELVINLDMAIPKNMGLTPRLDARKYIDTLVQNALVTAFLTSFEGVY